MKKYLGLLTLCLFLFTGLIVCAQTEPKIDIGALKEKALAGDLQAQSALGYAYSRGKGGVPIDAKEAMKWYRLAAEHGNAWAQHSIGIGYLNGEGMPKDEAEAVKWFRKSAEQGNQAAKRALEELKQK